MTTPWTRLEDTPLWTSARLAHDIPAGRHYHGFHHPLAMYAHAENTFGIGHDPALDKAILLHDVIVDGKLVPERRSVEWAFSRGVIDEAVHDMIMRTVDHAPGRDNRLVLLDLADFTVDDLRRRNTELLMKEAADLSGTTPEEFLEGCHAYLSALHDRIRSGVGNVPDWSDAAAFDAVSEGIARTIEEIETHRAGPKNDTTPCPE